MGRMKVKGRRRRREMDRGRTEEILEALETVVRGVGCPPTFLLALMMRRRMKWRRKGGEAMAHSNSNGGVGGMPPQMLSLTPLPLLPWLLCEPTRAVFLR